MSRIIEFRKSAQKSEKQSVQGKTCAFTGHRPQSLPFGFDESDKRCTSLKSVMRDQIVALIENEGVTHFITGMALGVDMYAAEIVLDLKSKYPHITLKAQSLVRHKRSNGLWLHGNGIIISRQSVTRRPCCNGSTRRTAWTREIGTWSITPIIFSQYGMDAPAVPGIP